MLRRILLLVCLLNGISGLSFAQYSGCTFKPPFFHMHFGSGNVQDVNTASLAQYNRVLSPCPGDGYYAYAPYTSSCFAGDWHTLSEDHTPGDVGGNMLLVNSAYDEGTFLTTKVRGFKGGTTYQIGVWLMNLCIPSKKCPFPLLPNLAVRLRTPGGKTVANFLTGDLPRIPSPRWKQYLAQFTVPAGESELILTFVDNAPGGCGNDFAMDDITFRECVRVDPAKVVESNKTTAVVTKKTSAKETLKKTAPVVPAATKRSEIATVAKSENESPTGTKPTINPQSVVLVMVPLVLKQRSNSLVKRIEAVEGEIQFALYDNGEIDGDTVSVYHNNNLIVTKQRLSAQPILFRIRVDKAQPHHELVMVAENLGTIPPNTSLMTVTAKDKQYRVLISSTEQQNAKVIIDLKE